jgi:hypothetical protein
MEASASELVGNRFDGHNAVPFGFLPLIKLAGGFAISDRKVGSLDVRPCQKAVSVLGIAFALFLSIGDVGASHPFATVAPLGGQDLRVVASALGHASVTTTMLCTEQDALDQIRSWEGEQRGSVAQVASAADASTGRSGAS